ncbi:MAG: NAD(P)/FAD-dependent oxidoreductase [Myxococcales bacterium]|nr:NAD(P)/FAD-dependent oxidoreductase [Myxococcales bacterium]
MQTSFDVLICGAGMAGLTLARQLRRQHPQLSIAAVDKTSRPLREAAHKVGESSVELGSQYLERLGLREYLEQNHLLKFGLRFYPGGGQLPLEQRTEIGPSSEPIVQSYQIDRGIFESDLRAMLEEDGIALFEGHTVTDVELGARDEEHCVRLEGPTGELSLRSRWLIDATGRAALLRRKLKLTRRTRHSSSSGWFRVKGKLDVNELVPPSVRDWHDKAFSSERWRSTNHLMGPGYWLWIIPLSSGNTSIGVVAHSEYHDFKRLKTLEKLRDFIAEHEPVLARHLASREVLDFLCIRDYSHTLGRCWSDDRWGIVGEAGAFVDPLYSPGNDFIALANSFTEELIRVDLAGEDLETRTRELNIQYRVLVAGALDIFRDAAPIYGHAPAMLAKIYWDNFAYWTFLCQYYLRGIYRLSGAKHQAQVEAGQRIFEISNYVQSLLREWALLAPHEPEARFEDVPAFPSILVDTHMALQDEMTPDETLAYVRKRAQEAEEIAGELLVKVLSRLGEPKASELLSKLGIERWRLRISADRIRAEKEKGLARRRALSPLARDVERSLGRTPAKTDEAQMFALLRPLLLEVEAGPRVRAGA